MAAGSPPRPAALHPDLLLMDKPGRAVVRRTATALPGPRRVLLPRRAHHRTGTLDHDLERPRPALQVDQDRRPDHRPHLPLLLTHLRTGTLACDGRVRDVLAGSWDYEVPVSRPGQADSRGQTAQGSLVMPFAWPSDDLRQGAAELQLPPWTLQASGAKTSAFVRLRVPSPPRMSRTCPVLLR